MVCRLSALCSAVTLLTWNPVQLIHIITWCNRRRHRYPIPKEFIMGYSLRFCCFVCVHKCFGFQCIPCMFADDAAQLPSTEGQLPYSSPSILQVALAASLASLSASALAEEVGNELGMLWPTRVLPALLRALPYLTLYTDRCTSPMPLCILTHMPAEQTLHDTPPNLWHG